MMTTMRKPFRVAVLAALLGVAGCGDLLDVEAPGRLADENLNTENAFDALVEGMSADLTGAIDDMTYISPIASGELFHSGSYALTDEAQGILEPETSNGEFNEMQEARWVAENGIERMREHMDPERYESSPLVARAFLYAAIANRLLGEMMCTSTIDGGPEISNTQHFARAQQWTDSAIAYGGRADLADVVTAAYGVRATVRAWQDDWAGAVTDAERVPDGFVWVVPFAGGTANSPDLWYETHVRREFSVVNTMFEPNGGADLRTPWDTVFRADGTVQTGANGSTLFYQQLKYPVDDADVPAVKGPEMLLLRAEAQLRLNGAAGIPAAYSLMNEARAVYDMDPLTPAATLEEAWDDLHYERSATLWLEARHMWDARRWYEGVDPSAPEYFGFFGGADRLPGGADDRDTCFPIGDEELRSNPNFSGG